MKMDLEKVKKLTERRDVNRVWKLKEAKITKELEEILRTTKQHMKHSDSDSGSLSLNDPYSNKLHWSRFEFQNGSEIKHHDLQKQPELSSKQSDNLFKSTGENNEDLTEIEKLGKQERSKVNRLKSSHIQRKRDNILNHRWEVVQKGEESTPGSQCHSRAEDGDPQQIHASPERSVNLAEHAQSLQRQVEMALKKNADLTVTVNEMKNELKELKQFRKYQSCILCDESDQASCSKQKFDRETMRADYGRHELMRNAQDFVEKLEAQTLLLSDEIKTSLDNESKKSGNSKRCLTETETLDHAEIIPESEENDNTNSTDFVSNSLDSEKQFAEELKRQIYNGGQRFREKASCGLRKLDQRSNLNPMERVKHDVGNVGGNRDAQKEFGEEQSDEMQTYSCSSSSQQSPSCRTDPEDDDGKGMKSHLQKRLDISNQQNDKLTRIILEMRQELAEIKTQT